MQVKENNTKSTNLIGKRWSRLPIVIRAILTGFTVNTFGVGVWVLIATLIPAPWSIPLMGIFLVFYWKYFTGGWRPKHTKSFRQFCSRDIQLSKSVWKWGITAAVLLFIFLNAALVLTFRIVEFQPETFKTARYLNDVPLWIALAFLIMSSAVAGICEEVGFRGYMQAPLEQKYSSVIAISITSLIFVVVHLHQAWAGGVLIHIFVVSVMIGYLAYATNSLLPGILAHIGFDIVNFSYWWSDVAGTFSLKPIGVTGMDNHFYIAILIVCLAVIGFTLSILKLLKLKQISQSL